MPVISSTVGFLFYSKIKVDTIVGHSSERVLACPLLGVRTLYLHLSDVSCSTPTNRWL